MMGHRDIDSNYVPPTDEQLDYLGRNSFPAWLALNAHRVFPDSFFASLYDHTNGRPSVAPSQLMTLLLLQTHFGVSQREAMQAAKFDLRYRIPLGLTGQDVLCARSTYVLFRTKLLVSGASNNLFERALEECKRAGFFKSKTFRVAIDTTEILGWGAARDTYNLIADAITILLRELARQQAVEVSELAREWGFAKYIESPSIKGSQSIDWNNPESRRAFLSGLVSDAAKILQHYLDEAKGDSLNSLADEAATLLAKILSQNLANDPKTGALKVGRGVSKNRIPSAHDPEQRHGRKSNSKKFNGYKGELVKDVDSPAILGVRTKAGNEHDSSGSLESIELAESHVKKVLGEEARVAEVLADAAYGTGANRVKFADSGRELIAKGPKLPGKKGFTKDDFKREVTDEGVVRTCPNGKKARGIPFSRHQKGKTVKGLKFKWPKAECEVCPFRADCLNNGKRTKKKRKTGRTITEGPNEQVLREARENTKDSRFRAKLRERIPVEHAIEKIVRSGGRKIRYRGQTKAEFELKMRALTLNLKAVAKSEQIDREKRHFEPILRIIGCENHLAQRQAA